MLSPNFTIRPAGPDDLDAIERIVDEAYEPYVERVGRRPAPLDDDYARLIAKGHVHVAVAQRLTEEDGVGQHSFDRPVVVGLIVMFDGPAYWFVENIATAAEARRRGIGGALLERAHDLARRANRSTLRLYTHESMIENIGYYERAGFTQTHRVTENGFDRVYFERPVPDPTDDLREYYEEEARQLARPEAKGRRVELREAFVGRLLAEGRTSVIDFGSGPGSDAAGFIEAGLSYLGVDLAHGNGVLAAERGLSVVHGSMTHPPVRPSSFEAGWSLSALMHLTDDDMALAARAMCATLQPGSPVLVGVWGGDLGSQMNEQNLVGKRRPFELRSFDHNLELLAGAGTVEDSQMWTSEHAWEYHVVQLRTPG